MTHAVVRVSALVVALAAGACTTTLQDTVNGLAGDIESLFGASSPPAKHLQEIVAVNEGDWCTFRADSESPLERTRTAIRSLGACDYTTWGETAFVVQVLAKMSDGHQSSLVRTEALDTMTKLASRMFAAAEPPAREATHDEMIEAVKVLNESEGKDDSDREMTAKVVFAVTTAAAYPFERIETTPVERADLRAMARAYGEQLRMARTVLRRLAGPELQGFKADPAVREALDPAQVALSGAVIRLSLQKSLLGDATATTRATAAHHVGVLNIAAAAPVLRASLVRDPFASVRRESAAALAGYPREIAVPALIEALSDEMADVRGAAVRTLESVTGQTFGDDRTAWIRWWHANGAPKSAPGASR